MGPSFFGGLSAVVVGISVLPYIYHVYRREITPNLVSWGLWSIIGIALLLTYIGSGARDNALPAIAGAINPVVCSVLAVWRRSIFKKFKWYEWTCLFLGFAALVLWFVLRQNKNLMQYALYVSMAADLCAVVPTLIQVRLDPTTDRPVPWFIFAIGYAIAIPAITEWTFANYILPVYMTAGSGIIGVYLALPRIKDHVPLREWI